MHLPFSAAPKCGEYSFNLSALNATEEFLLKAELHLYLKVNLPLESNSYTAEIRPVYQDGRTVMPFLRDFQAGNEDHYVKFEVDAMLTDILKTGTWM